MEFSAPEVWHRDLTEDAYMLEQQTATLSYWNTRLLRRDAPARYIGVTHEYLSIPGPEPAKLYGAHFIDHADGANRPGKFERDVRLLNAELASNPEDTRSWFYLGRSYHDMGRYQDAAAAYAKRATMGGWVEEEWYSRLALSRVQRALEPESRRALEGALKAFEARPHRLEPLADLAGHYRSLGMNETACLFAVRGLANEVPTSDLLFVEIDARDSLRETMAICGF